MPVGKTRQTTEKWEAIGAAVEAQQSKKVELVFAASGAEAAFGVTVARSDAVEAVVGMVEDETVSLVDIRAVEAGPQV